MSKNNDITFTRPEYDEALPTWKRNRNVCSGPDAVKAGAHEHLPKLNPLDTSEANEQRNGSYLARAVFYAIAANTKQGLQGMAFRRDPTLSLPEGNKLEYLKTNADGAGTSIYQQSQQSLESVLEVARDGIYVDYAEDGKQAIILRYLAENIINWRTKRINGRNKLILVVLRECVEEEDGYGFNDVVQYRELAMEGDRFMVRVWRPVVDGVSKKYVAGEPYYPKPFGADHWDEIPFIFLGAQDNNPDIDKSPLEALISINLGHYRNSADYEDSVHFCGQIQPWISGLSEDWRDWLEKNGVKFGSRNPMLLPADGAMGMAQGQPNMIAKEAMDDKKAYMIALGARLIEQNGAAKTATQASGEQASGTSILGICCSNVSEAYTVAVMWCARYLGINEFDAISYAITKEFLPKGADANVLNAIVAAWQSGAVPTLDMIRSLQKMDIIDPASDPATILDVLNTAGPNFVGGNNGDGQSAT